MEGKTKRRTGPNDTAAVIAEDNAATPAATPEPDRKPKAIRRFEAVLSAGKPEIERLIAALEKEVDDQKKFIDRMIVKFSACDDHTHLNFESAGQIERFLTGYGRGYYVSLLKIGMIEEYVKSLRRHETNRGEQGLIDCYQIIVDELFRSLIEVSPNGNSSNAIHNLLTTDKAEVRQELMQFFLFDPMKII